jgi:VWFA-related protein
MAIPGFSRALIIALVAAPLAAPLTPPLELSDQASLPSVPPPGAASSSRSIKLDVVVNAKSGDPVTNLGRQDFTILVNKSPRPITSFRVLTPHEEPVKVIIFIDAVNTPYELVAAVRNATEKFLKSNGGALPHPTSIAVLTESGVQLQNDFSTDGMAISDDLEHRQIGLHLISKASQYSDSDRLKICLSALHQLAVFASSLPGRKIIVWISPGFPLVSGPAYGSLTPKAEEEIFGDVTYFSLALRQNNITLYDVNPIGTSESMFNANYYQTFVKGVAHPDDSQLADLSIQVLSAQTGGLNLESNNDIPSQIAKCLLDADSWYEITFDPPSADKPGEYHHIEVKLAQPGLVARTRTGYYSNPFAIEPAH